MQTYAIKHNTNEFTNRLESKITYTRTWLNYKTKSTVWTGDCCTYSVLYLCVVSIFNIFYRGSQKTGFGVSHAIVVKISNNYSPPHTVLSIIDLAVYTFIHCNYILHVFPRWQKTIELKSFKTIIYTRFLFASKQINCILYYTAW